MFRDTGAYLSGHFRLTSGLHSPEYLQCALVLQHPAHAERLGCQLASALRGAAGGETVGVVVSPAMGGLIIGHEVARALGTRFLFTERGGDGKMTMRRGFAIEPGEAAVVVEDVITTGGSTRGVIALLKAAGARPVAARTRECTRWRRWLGSACGIPFRSTTCARRSTGCCLPACGCCRWRRPIRIFIPATTRSPRHTNTGFSAGKFCRRSSGGTRITFPIRWMSGPSWIWPRCWRESTTSPHSQRPTTATR